MSLERNRNYQRVMGLPEGHPERVKLEEIVNFLADALCAPGYGAYRSHGGDPSVTVHGGGATADGSSRGEDAA